VEERFPSTVECTHMGLVLLGRLKYSQQSHGCVSRVPLNLRWLLKKLRHKLPSTDQIPAELIKAEGRAIRSEIHKLINSVWNKEELPEEWKESIIVPVYKKGDKRDCSNYRGISLLPTTYKILSNILLSRLTPYAEEIIGDHQCRFLRNTSTIDHIFCIRQILEKKWEYNEAMHQLFIDCKKGHN